MGAASRKRKSNKRNNTNKPDTCNTPRNHTSNDKKTCNGTKGNKAGKRNNKGNSSMSEGVHIHQHENQSHGEKAVDPSPAIDNYNEPVDDSHSQVGVSVPEAVENDEISDAAPTQTPYSSIPETVNMNISSSHNLEVNISHEEEEEVPSTKSTDITNNGSISEVHSPELGVCDVPDQISSGPNNAYEQGIALLSSPKYVEQENKEMDALAFEPNNLCRLTTSPSHTVSDFVESEDIKEMDETSQIHLRNPIDTYSMVLKPGHDHDQTYFISKFKINGAIGDGNEHNLKETSREHSKNDKNGKSEVYILDNSTCIIDSHTCTCLSEVDDANPCVVEAVPVTNMNVENSVSSFKNNQTKGGREEDGVSPSSSASVQITETGRHEKSNGADEFAEFQPMVEQVDMKIEKATWKNCCGLFSLSMR